jgi:hypothetical protein
MLVLSMDQCWVLFSYAYVLLQVRQGNWAEATEMLGEANPFRDSGQLIDFSILRGNVIDR